MLNVRSSIYLFGGLGSGDWGKLVHQSLCPSVHASFRILLVFETVLDSGFTEIGLDTADIKWMERALKLAKRGEGRTRPNPPVGAVVVKAGHVLGEGYHHRAGLPHAEVEALGGLGKEARGATIYVTLEPCSTQGRTPPCTSLIIAKCIKRVVISVSDPNPKHRGRGLLLLRKAGIEVVENVCSKEGKILLAPFAKWVTTGKPFVTLKMGMTLDGRIADSKGTSRWITGAASRAEVRRLRQRSDAIMVGKNTAVLDNPSLRWSKSAHLNPKRIVIDSTGKLSPQAQVFSDGQNTIIATTQACSDERVAEYLESGATVWRCGRGKRVSLSILMKKLGEVGIMHLLCEGGGELAEQLVRSDLVDVFEFFVAPKIIGGRGTPVLGGNGWNLKNAPELKFIESRMVGGDVWIRGVRKT